MLVNRVKCLVYLFQVMKIQWLNYWKHMVHILKDNFLKPCMLVTWVAVIKEENLHVLPFVIEPSVVKLQHT